MTKRELFIYFMNPAFPSPLESTFGLSLSIKLGLWVEEVVSWDPWVVLWPTPVPVVPGAEECEPIPVPVVF
jgi:hypothetical protein